MKKTMLMAVLTIMGITVSIAQGDSGSSNDGFRWGVTAGVNFASVTGDDVDGVDSRTGLRIGAAGSFGISEVVSIKPEIVYSMRGWKDGDFTIKFDYIDVPVMADFEIAEGLSLQGGPLIGFNLSAKFEGNGNSGDIENASTLNAAAAVGAQYEFSDLPLFINVRYDMGFNDVIDNNFDARNCNLSASVGFYIE